MLFTLPSFSNVDMGTSVAGNAVCKIFRHADEMIAAVGEGAFKALVRGLMNSQV